MGSVYSFIQLVIGWLLVSLPLIVFLYVGVIESQRNLYSYDVGILAYVGWLIALYISTRPNWLVRWFGMGRLMFWHRVLGSLTLVTAIGHYWFSFTMHSEIKYTGLVALILSVIAFLIAVLILSPLGSRSLIGFRHLKTIIRERWSRKSGLWLHRLYISAILLGWLHVHLIIRIANSMYFMMLFDGYTLLVLAIYGWHKLKG
ncbi:Uncharacterised protein [Veillonella criceti]|uniref:Flavocytochrome yedZ n=2 Tax=Veillonella criceti TaxID=103891 RepID=A0A380NJI3_9FIRM|nr:Uncharacterised protein [Veillonella criceti]